MDFLEAIAISSFIIQLLALVLGTISIGVFFWLRMQGDISGKLTVSALISGVIYSIPIGDFADSQLSCQLQGIVEDFGLTSLCIWSVCSSYYIMRVVNKKHISTHSYKIYALVGLLTATTISGLGALENYIKWDEEAEMCIVTSARKLNRYLLITKVFPISVCVIGCFILFTLSFKQLRELRRELGLTLADTFGIVLLIPLTILILWTPELIYFILLELQAHPSYNLGAVFITIARSQVLFVQIGFFFLTSVKAELKEKCNSARRINSKRSGGMSMEEINIKEQLLEEAILRKVTPKAMQVK